MYFGVPLFQHIRVVSHFAGEYWVTRSCHNSKTVSDGDSPDGCYDLPNDGDSCYCYDANEPCNGQESKVLSLVILSIGVLLCWLY